MTYEELKEHMKLYRNIIEYLADRPETFGFGARELYEFYLKDDPEITREELFRQRWAMISRETIDHIYENYEEFEDFDEILEDIRKSGDIILVLEGGGEEFYLHNPWY